MTDIERLMRLAGVTEAYPQLQPLPAAQHVIDKYVVKVASALNIDLDNKTAEPTIRSVLTAFARDLEIFSK